MKIIGPYFFNIMYYDSPGSDAGGSNVDNFLIYPHVFRLGGIYGPGRSALDTVKKAANLKQLPTGEDKNWDEANSIKSADKGTANWVSRVHVADICGAIIASMEAPVIYNRRYVTGVDLEKGMQIGSVYNVADNYPAPREEVMRFAETLLAESNLLRRNSSDGTTVAAVSDVALSKSDEGAESKSRNASTNGDLVVAVSVSGTKDQGEKNVGERARRRTTENKRVNNNHLVSSLGYVFKYPSYREGLRALAAGSNDPFE